MARGTGEMRDSQSHPRSRPLSLPRPKDRAVAPAGLVLALRLALGSVLADPGSWAWGTVGFLARGGLLLLALPILSLPGLVELTSLLGSDALDASGLSARLLALIAAGLVVTGTLVLIALLVQAAADLALWRRSRDPTSAVPGGRMRTVLALAGLRLLTLLPAALALGLVVLRAVQVGREEYVLPTDLGVPFAVRIARGAAGPLAILLLAFLGAELVASAGVRRILAARSGRPFIAPRLAMLITGAAAWLVSLVVWLPLLLLLGSTWRMMRAAYLGPHLEGPLGGLSALVLTPLFVAVWLAALAVAGVASAVRAAFLTARMRPPG